MVTYMDYAVAAGIAIAFTFIYSAITDPQAKASLADYVRHSIFAVVVLFCYQFYQSKFARSKEMFTGLPNF